MKTFQNRVARAKGTLSDKVFLSHVSYAISGRVISPTSISIPLSPIQKCFHIMLDFLSYTLLKHNAVQRSLPPGLTKRSPLNTPSRHYDKLTFLSTHSEFSSFCKKPWK